MNKLITLLLASTLLAACAADATDESQGADANEPKAEENVGQAREELTTSIDGTTTVDTSLFKACVNKCEDWCVWKNGRKICGTSCICVFQ